MDILPEVLAFGSGIAGAAIPEEEGRRVSDGTPQDRHGSQPVYALQACAPLMLRLAYPTEGMSRIAALRQERLNFDA